MTTQADLDDFLAQKRLAIVGVSRRSGDFSRELFREFRKQGYDPVPVHPIAAEIEGARCFPRVQDVQPPVDTVLLMTPPGATAIVAMDCIAAGVKRVWFYRGAGTRAINEQAIEHCRAAGLQVIPGECPMMFFPRAGLVHRFHGWIKKVRGTYPG
jgi:predicted CoA-binding protein